jgi:hypothetical protein
MLKEVFPHKMRKFPEQGRFFVFAALPSNGVPATAVIFA